MEINVKELRNDSIGALEDRAAEFRAKIRDLRFTIQTRQQSRVRELRNAKRNLARILTLISEAKQKEITKKTV